MHTLFADIRLALRGMARRPGLTLVVVLTLALGTGANAAIFSAVDGLLLRQPPPLRRHPSVRRGAVRQPAGLARLRRPGDPAKQSEGQL